jgi:hypothetical protein
MALSDETITSRVLEIVDRESYKKVGIDHISLAREINVSLAVAKEQLQLAEDRGFLVRDDFIGGVYFFRNRFEEFLSGCTSGASQERLSSRV